MPASSVPEPASCGPAAIGAAVMAVHYSASRTRPKKQHDRRTLEKQHDRRAIWRYRSYAIAVWFEWASRSVAVDVWVTTGDKSQLLKQQTDLLFEPGPVPAARSSA